MLGCVLVASHLLGWDWENSENWDSVVKIAFCEVLITVTFFSFDVHARPCTHRVQARGRPAGDPMSEAFAKYNRNGDGMLDREEVRAMLLDCNFEIDDDYIAQVRIRAPTRVFVSVLLLSSGRNDLLVLVCHFQVLLIFF